MINAIIIDDEKNSRELLKNLLEQNCNSDIAVLALAENVTKAEQHIRNMNPELLFLDIEIAGKTGFDLLEKIQDLTFDVIFTTAFDHYALKAIKYSAIDYLLKPIDVEELKLAVEKIKKKQEQSTSLSQLQLLLQNFKQLDIGLSKISLPTYKGFEIIILNDIIHIESEAHHSSFHLNGGRKVIVSFPLRYYEDILPTELFMRIHNSHIINVEQVVQITKDGFAVLSNTSVVEISRRKKELLLKRLGLS